MVVVAQMEVKKKKVNQDQGACFPSRLFEAALKRKATILQASSCLIIGSGSRGEGSARVLTL